MAALAWEGLWSGNYNPTSTSILLYDPGAMLCNLQNRIIKVLICKSHSSYKILYCDLVEETQSNGEVGKCQAYNL